MSLQRISIACPGASAAELTSIARWADAWNLAGLWLGDPCRSTLGGDVELDDSYLTATAAAVAAVTRDIRIGVLLGLHGERHPLRLAEDLGVIDLMSGGRVEIGLVPPSGQDEEWTARVKSLLHAWSGVEVPGRNEEIHVMPAPVQPTIRYLTPAVERTAGLEDQPGRIRLTAGATLGDLGPRRTVLTLPVELEDEGVQGWLAADPVDGVLGLRRDAEAAEAGEVMLVFRRVLTEQDVRALGTVVVAGARANPREVRSVIADAWRWLLEGEPMEAANA